MLQGPYIICLITTSASATLFPGAVIVGPARYYHLRLVVAFWFIAV